MPVAGMARVQINSSVLVKNFLTVFSARRRLNTLVGYYASFRIVLKYMRFYAMAFGAANRVSLCAAFSTRAPRR